MEGIRRIWLLTFLVRRWRHAMWLCPLFGFLFGVVLFYGLLVCQPVVVGQPPARWMMNDPRVSHEALAMEAVEILRSDQAMAQVCDRLKESSAVPWMTVWDLRRRTEVILRKHRSSGQYEDFWVKVRYPTEEGGIQIVSIFDEMGNATMMDLYRKRVDELDWAERLERAALAAKLEALGTLSDEEAARLAELKSEEVRPSHGLTSSLSACSFGPLPWWERIGPGLIFLGKSTGYGLLACFPLLYVLEWAFPRKL